MTALTCGKATAAAMVVAAVAGVWAGQNGLLHLPSVDAPAKNGTVKPSGATIYYRDPDKRPFYSLTPRKTDDGRDYVPVLDSEDVNFDAKPAAASEDGGRKIKYYRNPMGLPDTSPVPKKDSMGMDYIAVYDGEEFDDGSVKVPLGKLQRTGVEITTVGKHAVTRTISAPGVVQLDERRIAVIAPRFDGYVVKVGPATSGTHVKRGDILATIFGQEILNQGARLLIEQNSGWTRGDEASSPAGIKGPGGLIGATRRLQNLGVPQEFLDEIKSQHRVPDTFALRAPMDGVILERNVVDGQGFKVGDVAFRLADHSAVWMIADVAEGDIDALNVGQRVIVTTRARPGRVFNGTLTVIYPHLMRETRTARARIELPNPDLALLPEMYGEVKIATGGNDDVLSVPASAIIDSGARQVVLIDRGEGRFEPRAVKVGRKGDGFVEILDGVAIGDRVVVNGNFLIDAESNLQAALKAFSEPARPEVTP